MFWSCRLNGGKERNVAGNIMPSWGSALPGLARGGKINGGIDYIIWIFVTPKTE